jgi:hypothetical protein
MHPVIGLDSQLSALPQPSSTMPQVPLHASANVLEMQLGGGGSMHLPLFAPVPHTLPLLQPPVSSVQFSTAPQPSPVRPHSTCCWAQV